MSSLFQVQTETPPPPFFGVTVKGEPSWAHSFDPHNDWRSACGIRLRLMRREAESELVTCPKCAEIAREWAKG